MANTLTPLSEWPALERHALVGVITDIDDTLTHHGRITPDALQALHDLRSAGLAVIAITGRPIGWCLQHVCGDDAWPVDAIVAENGALAWVCGPNGPVKHYQQGSFERHTNQSRMQAVALRIAREVPEARLTADSHLRETDLTIDHAEHCAPDPQRSARVRAIMHAEGMQTCISSIHIHGCFGPFDKWQGANWIVPLLRGHTLQSQLQHWVCIGDSGNDEPLFRHFHHSVGVANIRQLADALAHLPRYVTQASYGAGFAELTRAILDGRAP